MLSVLLCTLALAAPPNVIVLMTDDQGYGDLACHGNKVLRTPNLDQLHSQSVRLTNFHVDPTCSPTRSALLTGRYSSRTGVWHTIGGRSLLRRDEKTLANHFAEAGYQTGIFGKWHLGDNYPFRAQDRGWQTSLVHGGGGVGQTPDAWNNNYFNDTYRRNGKAEKQSGYCTDVFFANALRFIESNRDKPFLCYVPTNAPHAPYNVDPKYSKPYRDQGVPVQRANFYGMIENVDENVGKLLAKLREWKLEDNTIVVYLTDNGSAAGWNEAKRDGFNAGMRAMKGSPYDGGHRVPCFLRWPGKLPAGRDVGQLTAHIDVVPTLLDLCGLKATYPQPIDGVSLRPLLEGKSMPPRTLFVHSQRIEHPEKWRQCAVMTERWRLVNGTELFDVSADPGQRKNVAETNPEVVKDLRAAYEKWYADISPRFGEYCEIVLGSDRENPAMLTGHDWHGDVVPWNHESIKKLPVANGFWAIEVEKAGRYRFTLRHQPAEAKCVLKATKARIQIGKVEGSAAVVPGATEVAIEVKLEAGKARLQTWLEGEGAARGAFYVEVRRLE